MKKKWIVFSVLGLFVIGVVGVFFVFGDDAIDAVGGFSKTFISYGDNAPVNVNDDPGVTSDERSNEGSSSGGGGGNGGSDSGDVGLVCIESKQIQYSLGEFTQEPECLVYGIGTCEKVKMVCSAELNNLDDVVGGTFIFRYSLTSNDEILYFESVEADVGPREKSVLITEIIKEGEFDVGSLECMIDMENIPRKCLAWG